MTLDLSLSSVFDIVIHHGWEKYHCSALLKKKTASDVRSEEPSKISELLVRDFMEDTGQLHLVTWGRKLQCNQHECIEPDFLRGIASSLPHC